MEAKAANPKPIYIPSPQWKIAGTILIATSCLLIVTPILKSAAQSLDTNYPLQDFYIIVRTLLVIAGFVTFHLATYHMAVFRRIKRGALTICVAYGFITLGVFFGRIFFQS